MKFLKYLVAATLLAAAASSALAGDRMPLPALLEKLDGQKFDVRGIEFKDPWWVVVLRTPRGKAMTAGFDARTGTMQEHYAVEMLAETIPADTLKASDVLKAVNKAGHANVEAIRYQGGRYLVETAGSKTVTVDARTGAILP